MDVSSLILTYVIVFSVASVLSMFGKGGGEFYVPLLITLGMPFQSAASTSLHCLAFSGTAMTFIYHQKMRQVDWHLAAVLFSTAGVSAFLGGFFSGGIEPFYLKITFSVTLFVAAGVMYFRMNRPAENERNAVLEEQHNKLFWVWHRSGKENSFDMNLLLVLPPVAIVAFLAGMVGISGGSLIVPIMIILGGVPIRRAFATNSVLVLLTSLMGLFGRGITLGLDLSVAVPIAFFAMVGALTGSTLSGKIETARLQRYFIVVIIVAGLWMLYRAFG